MSTAWNPWSDWAVDDTSGIRYRVRRDSHGQFHYDYDRNFSANAQTPRDPDSQQMDEMVQNVQDLNISPTSNYGDQGYELNNASPVKPRSSKSKGKDRDRTRERDRDRDKGKGKGKDKVKDKGKSHQQLLPQLQQQQQQQQLDRKSHRTSQHAATASHNEIRHSSASDAPGQLNYAYDPNPSGFSTPSGSSTGATTYAVSYMLPENESMDEAQQMQRIIAASQQVQYGITRAPGASSTAAGVAYTSAYDENDYFQSQEAPTYAGEDQFEEMDPRYRIEQSSKFSPGEIFKVYWSEPQGTSQQQHASVSGRHETQNRFGVKFFVGFRRFIVIANDQGHCTCVPILTYGGRACNKHGVKPAKHGIVYQQNQKPRMLPGEPKLGFPAVQAHIKEDGERLSKESRVNYSKLVTVEHNIKVFFIGSIMQESMPDVNRAVNDCWYQKPHSTRLFSAHY